MYPPMHLLSLIMALSSLTVTQQQILLPVTMETPYTCENNTEIEFCFEIGHDTIRLPNLRGHETQSSANSELLNFAPLIQGVCSNAIAHFLCSVYAPFCIIDSNIQILPCRELCEYVRATCEQPIREFGLNLPDFFNCSRYPSDADTLLDFCPPNLTMLQIPNNIEINSPIITDASFNETTSDPATVPTTSPAEITCPVNMYLVVLSNDEIVCSPCPERSFSSSTTDRTCLCIQGYFRNKIEGPEVACTSK